MAEDGSRIFVRLDAGETGPHGSRVNPTAAARSDIWIWTLVGAASHSVIALAVVQSHRAAAPLPPPDAKRALAVSLPSLDGPARPLPQGKVTLIDFWATWCGPCKYSMPRVQKLYSEYKSKGMELYSVDTDDPGPNRDPSVREFLMQYQLTFPVQLDDGTATEAFSIASLPTMVLLDKKGQVVWQDVGALTSSHEEELRAKLDAALSPAGAP
jgi:thiol-disulfide isomerase/thioredoxin